MKLNRALLVMALFLAATQGASAATSTGPGALAFAALVADRSPTLFAVQKHRMAHLLDGFIPSTPAGYKIIVRATKVLCHVSDVDLTARGCTLTFGTATVSLRGRHANELFATMREAGIPSGAAAGTIYESASTVICTIDFTMLRMRAGGGATCTYV